MRQNRFRVRAIVKVLCAECEFLRSNKKPFDTRCSNCNYLKYNNVNNLISFTQMLHKQHANWIWFNVYEYVKNEPGRRLQSFQKGKNEPLYKTL